MGVTSSHSGYTGLSRSVFSATPKMLASQWIKIATITDAEQGVGISNINLGPTTKGWIINAIQATDEIEFVTYGSGGAVRTVAGTGGAGTAGVGWIHIAGYFDTASGVQKAWRNGVVGSSATPGDEADPSDLLGVATRLHLRTNTDYVAEVAVWSGLSESEADAYVALLAAGQLPHRFPKLPISYYDCRTGGISLLADRMVNGANTMSGTCVAVEHPAMWSVPRSQVVRRPPFVATGPYPPLLRQQRVRRIQDYVGG